MSNPYFITQILHFPSTVILELGHVCLFIISSSVNKYFPWVGCKPKGDKEGKGNPFEFSFHSLHSPQAHKKTD